MTTPPGQNYVLDGNAVVVDQMYLKNRESNKKFIIGRESTGSEKKSNSF